MQDRLPIVAVHPRGEALGEEEGGGVLEETGPHTGGELLQEERSELAPDGGETLLGWTVVPAAQGYDSMPFIWFLARGRQIVQFLMCPKWKVRFVKSQLSALPCWECGCLIK